MNSTKLFPKVRLRRLRHHPKIRDLIRNTQLSVNDLVLPLFIHHDADFYKPVSSMPGHAQMGINHLAKELKEIVSLHIPAILLFGIPAEKDHLGSDSYAKSGVIQQAIDIIKQQHPELLLITDCCFCEYTDHGHCGVIEEKAGSYELINDATLELLQRQAISHAQAGADVIAPSGMIDGMVQAIREGLDNEGFANVSILSYSVKYASAFYGPFREATEGAPQFGDRKTYQMDPANQYEALREAELDIAEGADMLMVKPALAYLDIIAQIKQTYPGLPLGAYQVSGEYSMIKAAAMQGWLDEKQVTLESLMAIKRAGADFIINYFAKEVAKWLRDS